MTKKPSPTGSEIKQEPQGTFNFLKPYFEHPRLQKAYDHFNHELFNDALPPCLILSTHYDGITQHRKIKIESKIIENILIDDAFLKKTSIEEVLYALLKEMEKMTKHSSKIFAAPRQPITYRTFMLVCERLVTAPYAVRWYKAYSNFISSDFL